MSNSDSRRKQHSVFMRGREPLLKIFLRGICILIGALICWSAVTDNSHVWPVRNTIEYYAARSWWNLVGEPGRTHRGSIEGVVSDEAGRPVAQAVVLVSEWDGRVHSSLTDQKGRYRIEQVPVGFYRLASVAPGYSPMQSGGVLRGVTVRPDRIVQATCQLQLDSPTLKADFQSPQQLEPQELVCQSPVAGSAKRETLRFDPQQWNELVFLYRPVESGAGPLPVLLTVYPGPVDTWECVSIGLAQAGYAVLAVGPAYGLDLTKDVDALQKLLSLVKQGGIAGLDGERIAALGGSYSALLLELLMLRDPGLSAVILLGPPTDMFDFRRRFEREGFRPPFGLDRALVALGLPSRDPLRYLKHSMVYHVRPGLPATQIFHSYQDEIVPYQQSSLLADSLSRQGVETELHLFEGASHYLLEDGAAAMKIYQQTLDFLRRHGMAPFPGKGR